MIVNTFRLSRPMHFGCGRAAGPDHDRKIAGSAPWHRVVTHPSGNEAISSASSRALSVHTAGAPEMAQFVWGAGPKSGTLTTPPAPEVVLLATGFWPQVLTAPAVGA